MSGLSLDGRRFRPVHNEDGEVGVGTTFEYREDGDLVWARYSGGPIRLGFLVGLRDGDVLSARYAQVTADGGTATGHTESRIEILADGRVRLGEAWAWDSKEGRGRAWSRRSWTDKDCCSLLPVSGDPVRPLTGKSLQQSL